MIANVSATVFAPKHWSCKFSFPLRGLLYGSWAVVLFLLLSWAQVASGQSQPAPKKPQTKQEKVAAKLAEESELRKNPFPDLKVVKKPNEKVGTAYVTLKGKQKVLAKDAFSAWTIMDNRNALVVVNQKSEKGDEMHLRFYEGDSRKYRDLGVIYLVNIQLTQGKLSNGGWVFMLAGDYDGKKVIDFAGLNDVHGEVENAHSPKLEGDNITWLDASNQPHTLPASALLASDMTDIYEPRSATESVKYLQFLRDGKLVIVSLDNQYRIGDWYTDGTNMILYEPDGKRFEYPRTELVSVTGVPATTKLAIRLMAPLASETTEEGDAVDAVLISPATIDNTTLIPQGSMFHGTVVDRHGVGWGIRHESAALTVEFTKISTPDGRTLDVHCRLIQVDNARESVSTKDPGKIQGIRSTATPAYSAQGKISSVASVDPIAYLFANVSASATLGFADPIINYPAGTELIVEFTSPLATSQSYPRAVPEFPRANDEVEKLYQMIRNLPFRTSTQASKKTSDITNLVFIGSEAGLRRAFQAAGWVNVDSINAGTAFKTIKTVGGNDVYNEAPMSTLLLDERPPIFTLTKTTNTFASRHHLRVFDPDVTFNGQVVLTSSATQDIRVAFSYKQKTFIHVIDEYIDNERAKVVNDLIFTGCVQAMDLVPRPWVPRDAYNSTGDRLQTDGAAAVMQINDCEHPRTTPTNAAPVPHKFKRTTRNVFLTLKNDIYRGNLIYTGISGTRWGVKYLKTKNQLQPVEGNWRMTDQSGTEFRGLGNIPRERQSSERLTQERMNSDVLAEEESKRLTALHRWDPPHYEIGVHGGYFRYPTVRSEALVLTITPEPGTTGDPYYVVLADNFESGWDVGISLTLNSWKWFSNRFTYSYKRGNYNFVIVDFSNPDNEVQTGSAPLATRQFDYNLEWNLRPPTSRWRPYLALGPSLLMMNIADSPIKKAAGPFKLGLQNVGLLIAAFDYGSTKPLDGGGVFMLGVNYGVGMKYRIHPHISLTADFRETISNAPNFLTDSYTREYFDDEGYTLTTERFTTEEKYRQQRFTAGIAFTF